MNIIIVCVGKLKEKYWKDACDEYLKRLSRYARVTVIEVNEEISIEREGDSILKKVKDKDFCITLEIKGKEQDSLRFAGMIEELGLQGKSDLAFVIGGSEGLSQAVLDRSDYSLSFSQMTYPHQMMRVILLEQIYRSYRILNGEPYHK